MFFAMQRFQFGLRFFLLLIALLATCFAWLGAVRSKLSSEREMARVQLEHSLAAKERWQAKFSLHVQAKRSRAPNSIRVRRDGAALKQVEARISAMRKELESMK
jgi:hypothetical protein